VDESTSLHGFANIVHYSRLNAYQQADFQERLVRGLEASLVDCGVRPDTIRVQDQGDARMLTFPDHLDVSRVLAIMPRRFNDELKASNQDKAPHARMQVRLSFAMGPSARGATGQRGSAPIAVTRLNNAPALHEAMATRPDAYLGVVIDDYLYHQHVVQQFRPDLAIDEYAPTRVSFPGKKDAEAWIRLVGYRVGEWLPDMGSAVQAARPNRESFELPADSVSRPDPGVWDDPAAIWDDPAAPEHAPRRGGGDGAGRGAGGRGRRERITLAVATIIAAVIAVGVGLLISYSGHSAGTGSPGRPSSGVISQGQLPPSTIADAPPASSAATPSGATFTEYGDWGPGVQVYANTLAATSNAPVIPLNQPVQVACVARNDSGIATINAFYRIVSGAWRGTYASCNEFTNGGTLDSADDPAIDPRVPHCTTA
jgi:hypothetical protein